MAEASASPDAAALIDRPQYVTVYSEDGIAVQVRPEDAPKLLARGYTRERFDLDRRLQEYVALSQAAERAVREWVAEVKADSTVYGETDRAKWTAEIAVRDAAIAWLELHQGIGRSYSHSQGRTVTLRAPRQADLMDGSKLLARRGQTIEVDPTQVELYKALGAEDVDGS